MSNLSELLPAGSSVKSADFVAQGTLASGVTVGLRSDGKVEAITGTSTDIGTKSAAIFSAASAYGTSAYDINSDRYVIAFQNSSTGYPTAVVAQLTGTTFTFGTPVVWQSATATREQAIYDPDQNKVVIFYQTRLGGVDNSGTGIVGNVTAGTNSITFGTAVSWMTKSNNAWSMAYDTTADRIVGHYYDNGNNNYLYGVVAAVSGTTITFGTPVVVRSTDTHSSGGTVYDAYRNKIIYVYKDGSVSNAQYAGIGTVNAGSNSISYTTAQAVGSDASQIFLTYDPVSYKTVDLYRVDGDLTTTKYRVITNSGSSLTFGAEATAFSESANIILYRPVYDVTNSRIVQPYVDVSDTTPGNYGIVYRTATISGDTVTYSDKTDLGIASDFYGGAHGLSCDQSNAKFVLPFRDNTDSTYPKAVAFTAGATNASSFIGITDQAISSAATGKVVCKGGAITNTGLFPYSLSFGSSAVFESTTAGYTATAYDSNNNKIVVGYSDSQGYGAVSIGTVSGSAISYATPVRYTAQGGTSYNTVVYDPTNQKVVAIYMDSNNSNHGYAVVGTVSGTTTSWGSPVVFTANNSRYYSAAFDSNAGKIVIAYQNQANTYGQAIVGTVSGTSISFGTAVTFEAASARYVNIGFDSNVNKVVIAYRDDGNSGYGTSIVGTVSGTSISFGSAVIFESAESSDYNVVFDSNANKVVIAYSDVGNAYKGTAIVGTVSGTSISFGSASIFNSGTIATGISASFDSAQNKVIVGYLISSDGEAVVGTVSGTSISFDTPVEFSDGYLTYVSSVYDANSSATVFNYMDSTGSNDGTGIVGSLANDLTPNTAYFVQDDGTISTTSSTTKAGTALSTTSLLLTG